MTPFLAMDKGDRNHSRFNPTTETEISVIITNRWPLNKSKPIKDLESYFATVISGWLGHIDIVVDIECDCIDDLSVVRCIAVACTSQNLFSCFGPLGNVVCDNKVVTLNDIVFE